MKKCINEIVAITIMFYMFVATSCIKENNGKEIQIGEILPTFQVTDNDGTATDTSIRDSKPWIIVFFNTSCPDCQRELPSIQKLYNSLSTKSHFLIIAREESAESINAYWNTHGLTMPYIPQPDRVIYSLFAFAGIPRIYIADMNGTITNIFSDSEMLSSDSFKDYIQGLKE